MTEPPTPLRGRYLVRHRLLNALLRGVDRVLSCRARSSGAIGRPGRLLVANIAHLGDALLSTGVLAAVRRAFPGAFVGFLAGSWSRPVLDGLPLLDRLHTFDHARLNRSAGSLWGKLARHLETRREAVRQIREVGYDAAVDLYPYFPNAIPLLWRAGVPARVGYTSAGFGPLLTHPVDWPLRDWHVTRYHARLLEELPLPEGEPGPLRPVLPVQGPPLPPGLPEGFVVVHPGAGAAFKGWPVERWRAVVRGLREAGHAVVLTGHGQAERRTCEAVSGGCVDLCGRLSWGQFVAVVRRARLLVGVDSVAGHVAAAVDTPCVVVSTGITHPAHWAPLGPRVRVLRHPVPCAPCYQSRGCPAMACVREVGAGEVLRAALDLLAPPGDLLAGPLAG